MYINIKSKVGVFVRKVILVFFVVIIMFTMVACGSEEVPVTTQEFELVSCYIEYRDRTNGFGGIIRTDEYLHYGYIDANDEVTFNERYFYNSEFQITEGTPKVIIKTSRYETTYTFQLNREMYENINSSQK